MVRKKIPYVSPDISETQVLLESPICSGSVDITNPANDKTGFINEQTINQDYDSDAFSSNTWTEANE